MSPSDAASAFATVFVAELPDKTMVATIVLVARYRRPLAVWAGATLAFALHVTVAVAAGSAVARLPERLVSSVVLVVFTLGAIVMFLAARREEPPDLAGEAEGHEIGPTTPLRAAIGSFVFIAVAEWGDLTQIATAGLAARSDSPASIWIGAIAALATVAGIAATVGRQLVARLPVRRIQLIAAAIFTALALWTLIDLLNGS